MYGAPNTFVVIVVLDALFDKERQQEMSVTCERKANDEAWNMRDFSSDCNLERTRSAREAIRKNRNKTKDVSHKLAIEGSYIEELINFSPINGARRLWKLFISNLLEDRREMASVGNGWRLVQELVTNKFQNISTLI